MGVPLIPFWGLKTAKKAVSIAFLLSAVTISGSLMTKIDILTIKLIVPDDYQQFLARFEWFLALFHISDEKWLLS